MTSNDCDYMTDRELERQRRLLNHMPEEFQEYDNHRKVCIAWFVIFGISFIGFYMVFF